MDALRQPHHWAPASLPAGVVSYSSGSAPRGAGLARTPVGRGAHLRSRLTLGTRYPSPGLAPATVSPFFRPGPAGAPGLGPSPGPRSFSPLASQILPWDEAAPSAGAATGGGHDDDGHDVDGYDDDDDDDDFSRGSGNSLEPMALTGLQHALFPPDLGPLFVHQPQEAAFAGGDPLKQQQQQQRQWRAPAGLSADWPRPVAASHPGSGRLATASPGPGGLITLTAPCWEGSGQGRRSVVLGRPLCASVPLARSVCPVVSLAFSGCGAFLAAGLASGLVAVYDLGDWPGSPWPGLAPAEEHGRRPAAGPRSLADVARQPGLRQPVAYAQCEDPGAEITALALARLPACLSGPGRLLPRCEGCRQRHAGGPAARQPGPGAWPVWPDSPLVRPLAGGLSPGDPPGAGPGEPCRRVALAVCRGSAGAVSVFLVTPGGPAVRRPVATGQAAAPVVWAGFCPSPDAAAGLADDLPLSLPARQSADLPGLWPASGAGSHAGGGFSQLAEELYSFIGPLATVAGCPGSVAGDPVHFWNAAECLRSDLPQGPGVPDAGASGRGLPVVGASLGAEAAGPAAGEALTAAVVVNGGRRLLCLTAGGQVLSVAVPRRWAHFDRLRFGRGPGPSCVGFHLPWPGGAEEPAERRAASGAGLLAGLCLHVAASGSVVAVARGCTVLLADLPLLANWRQLDLAPLVPGAAPGEAPAGAGPGPGALLPRLLSGLAEAAVRLPRRAAAAAAPAAASTSAAAAAASAVVTFLEVTDAGGLSAMLTGRLVVEGVRLAGPSVATAAGPAGQHLVARAADRADAHFLHLADVHTPEGARLAVSTPVEAGFFPVDVVQEPRVLAAVPGPCPAGGWPLLAGADGAVRQLALPDPGAGWPWAAGWSAVVAGPEAAGAGGPGRLAPGQPVHVSLAAGRLAAVEWPDAASDRPPDGVTPLWRAWDRSVAEMTAGVRPASPLLGRLAGAAVDAARALAARQPGADGAAGRPGPGAAFGVTCLAQAAVPVAALSEVVPPGAAGPWSMAALAESLRELLVGPRSAGAEDVDDAGAVPLVLAGLRSGGLVLFSGDEQAVLFEQEDAHPRPVAACEIHVNDSRLIVASVDIDGRLRVQELRLARGAGAESLVAVPLSEAHAWSPFRSGGGLLGESAEIPSVLAELATELQAPGLGADDGDAEEDGGHGAGRAAGGGPGAGECPGSPRSGGGGPPAAGPPSQLGFAQEGHLLLLLLLVQGHVLVLATSPGGPGVRFVGRLVTGRPVRRFALAGAWCHTVSVCGLVRTFDLAGLGRVLGEVDRRRVRPDPGPGAALPGGQDAALTRGLLRALAAVRQMRLGSDRDGGAPPGGGPSAGRPSLAVADFRVYGTVALVALVSPCVEDQYYLEARCVCLATGRTLFSSLPRGPGAVRLPLFARRDAPVAISYVAGSRSVVLATGCAVVSFRLAGGPGAVARLEAGARASPSAGDWLACGDDRAAALASPWNTDFVRGRVRRGRLPRVGAGPAEGLSPLPAAPEAPSASTHASVQERLRGGRPQWASDLASPAAGLAAGSRVDSSAFLSPYSRLSQRRASAASQGPEPGAAPAWGQAPRGPPSSPPAPVWGGRAAELGPLPEPPARPSPHQHLGSVASPAWGRAAGPPASPAGAGAAVAERMPRPAPLPAEAAPARHPGSGWAPGAGSHSASPGVGESPPRIVLLPDSPDSAGRNRSPLTDSLLSRRLSPRLGASPPRVEGSDFGRALDPGRLAGAPGPGELARPADWTPCPGSGGLLGSPGPAGILGSPSPAGGQQLLAPGPGSLPAPGDLPAQRDLVLALLELNRSMTTLNQALGASPAFQGALASVHQHREAEPAAGRYGALPAGGPSYAAPASPGRGAVTFVRRKGPAFGGPATPEPSPLL
ncbi:hypothetical protein H696_05962 [Fonticula alba]|uniref:Uncharacterized protein n=1 Tax=Fonticula alba TaxID=691883 RepID=A0A058Z0X5_FONAL|nr:hypothetical protein H696_05962 [Fonticula alba]KCV67563.1 hypothetical protein H696_05962 [Fonticula alba]|eukprot:XP_009498004.1 hypothetical protein H696_05962 [Fonticula alba]